MSCTVRPWADTPQGPARSFIITHGGLTLTVSEWGATILGLQVPDRSGALADVVLAHREAHTYCAERNPGHLGCIAGRFANRIRDGRAAIAGRQFSLETNLPGVHLHGGSNGFHAQLWRGEGSPNAVRLTRTSPAGEAGYPGNLQVSVTYAVDAVEDAAGDDARGACLDVLIEARSDAPTLVNLAQHAYFNLGGHASGRVDAHLVRIPSTRVLEVDADLIPTGYTQAAPGVLALTNWTALGTGLRPLVAELQATLGYDHCFVLERTPAAEVYHPPSGRLLRVTTDQPALQLYSGGHLDNLPGKDGATYNAHHGFCLETQGYPNAPNIPAFPSAELHPGQVYRRITRYAFVPCTPLTPP